MRRLLVILPPLVSLLVACRSSEPTGAALHPSPSGSVGPTVAPAAMATAQAELDRLDARRPVPLLPMMAHHQKQNMRDHLLVVQEIVEALARDDFAGVEKAASRIGHSDQMARICEHMGAGASGFTPQALEFHKTADTISVAARDRDRARTLGALSRTLTQCTGCHAAFKQRVVGADEWRAATASAPPDPGLHH
jgi:hypothetical protein